MYKCMRAFKVSNIFWIFILFSFHLFTSEAFFKSPILKTGKSPSVSSSSNAMTMRRASTNSRSVSSSSSPSTSSKVVEPSKANSRSSSSSSSSLEMHSAEAVAAAEVSALNPSLSNSQNIQNTIFQRLVPHFKISAESIKNILQYGALGMGGIGGTVIVANSISGKNKKDVEDIIDDRIQFMPPENLKQVKKVVDNNCCNKIVTSSEISHPFEAGRDRWNSKKTLLYSWNNVQKFRWWKEKKNVSTNFSYTSKNCRCIYFNRTNENFKTARTTSSGKSDVYSNRNVAVVYPNRKAGTDSFTLSEQDNNKDLQYLNKPSEWVVIVKPKSSVLSNSDTGKKEKTEQSNTEIKSSPTSSPLATNTKLLNNVNNNKAEILTTETTVATLKTTTASTTVTTLATTEKTSTVSTTVSTTKCYGCITNRLGNASTKKPIIRRPKSKTITTSEALESSTATTIINSEKKNILGNESLKNRKTIYRPNGISLASSASATTAAATNEG